ncbi:PepSY domain-containing protein [Enterococcus sp. LJL98]
MNKKKNWVTLSILASMLLVVVGCSSPSEQVPQVNSQNLVPSTHTTNEEATSNDSSHPADSQKILSLEAVIQIYQDEYPKAAITSLDYDTSFNQWYFKIEGMDDTKEYELKIDPITGAIHQREEEMLDSEERTAAYRERKTLDLTNLAPFTEIQTVAVSKIGSGQATEMELEKKGDITYWQVTVEDGKKEHEVKVDAKTKAVLEVDWDD